MSTLHEQERGPDGRLRCTCQRDSLVPAEDRLVGTLDAWRHNAALHNAMRREIERVATYAAAHERTHEWISDRLMEILDDPKAWMETEPHSWSLPPEPGPEVTAVRATQPLYGLTLWQREERDGWVLRRGDGQTLCIVGTWLRLLEQFGPLTDASAEATS